MEFYDVNIPGMESHWRMILIAENNQVRQVFLPIKTIKWR